MTRERQILFAKTVNKGNVKDIILLGDKLFIENTWKTEWLKIRAFFIDSNFPVYSIFTNKSIKMSFWQFSTLPLFTCPGAGTCVDYCYSLKSWRIPQPFFRQCQNTFIINNIKKREFRKLILNKMDCLSGTLRLYVDGDFNSINTLTFWMDEIKYLIASKLRQ